MEVRGDRECRECGTRWSYFETGSVACPGCGSVHSVGVGGRTEHTDGPADLALGAARRAAAEDDTREAARHATDAAADYVRTRGFVNAGDLLPLDDVYVAAQELRYAGADLARRVAVDDTETRYFLALLRGAPDGDRPDDVPASLRDARGLATAAATREYAGAVSRWLGESTTATTRDCLEELRAHRKRVEALDGAVSATAADALLGATRALGEHARGDEGALAVAHERLEVL